MAVARAIVTISHPVLGGQGTNTWHARATDPVTGGPESDLNSLMALLEQFYADCTGIFAGGTSFNFSGEMAQVGVEDPALYSVEAWSYTASNSDPALPPANAIVAGWVTAGASRRARGRTFLGPLNLACVQADGTPTDAALGLVRTAQDNLIAGFDGIENGAFGVWSTLDNQLRDFVGRTVHNQFAVLRSRRD